MLFNEKSIVFNSFNSLNSFNSPKFFASEANAKLE